MTIGLLDSWTIERDGITYRIDIDPDYESSPDDDDGRSPSDKVAFDDGDWEFVHVTVTPIVDGQDIDAASDSLGGVEWGTIPAETEPWEGAQHGEFVSDRAYVADTHPVPDMLSEVRGNLAKLRDALNKLPRLERGQH